MGDDGRSSPPSSPTLVRQATVVRRCRDFYARRLQTSEALRRKWHHHRGSGSDSECSSTLSSTSSAEDTTTPKGENVDTDSGVDDVKEPVPCRGTSLMSVDVAMNSLRKEISSLIECDNALFRQLLNLYDSITELRRQRARHSGVPCGDEDDDDDISAGLLRSPHAPGSLESLSAYEDDEDEDEAPRRRVTSSSTSSSPSCECSGSSGLEDTTASSDLSRSSSNSTSAKAAVQGQPQVSKRHSAMVGLGCRDGFCSRCPSLGVKKRTPVYRRRPVSYAGSGFGHRYTDSFDSGIHLHGGHSESDHEIFV